jgi:hypothetical protein
VQCEDLATALAASPDGHTLTEVAAQRHVDGCLRCQAELAQYRKLLRALHNLRTEVLDPAPGLIADVMSRLEASAERTAVRSMIRGRKAAYVGGIAVATAAAGAGAAFVLATRGRRRAAGIAS